MYYDDSTVTQAMKNTKISGKKGLYQALLRLQDPGECRLFFQDLCTPAEVRALQERWEIATLLDKGLSYREVQKRSGASLVTIGRVARFLKEEDHGGYRLLLDRCKQGKPSLRDL